MSEENVSNPFLALFSCPNDVDKCRELLQHDPARDDDNANKNESKNPALVLISPGIEDCCHKYVDLVPLPDEVVEHSLSLALEDIFLFTISEVPCCDVATRPTMLVYLKEVHLALKGKKHLDLDCLKRALFERLLIHDASSYMIVRGDEGNQEDLKNSAAEGRIMFYLHNSLYRLYTQKNIKITAFEHVKKIIISQVVSCLCAPDLFPESNIHDDFIELYVLHHFDSGHQTVLAGLIIGISLFIIQEKKADLMKTLSTTYNALQDRLNKTSLRSEELFEVIGVLHYFAKSEDLAKALVQYSMPENMSNGKDFQNTLLGLPLCISCLPRTDFDSYEFFQDPLKNSANQHRRIEEGLWDPIKMAGMQVHIAFYNIMRRSSSAKHMLLKWIGACLKANSGRAKLWNSQVPEMFGSLYASDGFFINFESLILKLCMPFCHPESHNLPNIDPTYTASSCSEAVHLNGFFEETCLIPRKENEDLEKKEYSFSTEIFFAAHCTLKLGFRVIHEKMIKLNQELLRIQRLYEEARTQAGDSSEVVLRIKENMEKGMTKFLSYRTAILVPETLETLLKYHITTARWLVNLATNTDPNKCNPPSFPLSNSVPNALSYVPEFIVENIADCVIFIKRFSPTSFEMVGDVLHHLMTMILVFMGSPERVKNPHLRAQLAEMLEALMPLPEDEQILSLMPSIYRENLFTSHPFDEQLVPTLLHVFVSIEMTGQSVAFEQKFQYRRPMYVVLDYLWKKELHKRKMKELADEAEKNIESSHPPLFLHFINLLINDAIFLLDEAFSCMTKLREMQIARDSDEWNSLTAEQRYRQEGNFHHLGLLAKFHNVMSNETIHTLQFLTTEIKSIFCHPTMIERIAAMLNYFLLHLVGPRKRNLKVKDLKEYEFKPQELVCDICRIYINLGLGEETDSEAFCLAVYCDGRSYSSGLFPQAQAVLTKIGHRILGSELEVIANKIERLACRQQQEEDMLAEAPDEFLDPIMNTVMKDPVKLPSSGMTLDRSTIARHLLSDQTDPFNRSPLTMDMVKPDNEMKEKISKWFHDRLRML